MAENDFPGIFSFLVKIKRGEFKIALLLFFYLFLVIAAYNVIKPIRNASLLEELGYQWLPLVYLLTAMMIGFVVHAHSKFQVRISRLALISSSILFFFVSCLVFRLFSGNGWQGLPIIFWVWANVFIIVLNTQFWIVVNDILNPREFKRLSGFFISGGILGGFLGGVLAGLLAEESVDYDLLLLSAGLLALCALVVHLIFRRGKKEESGQKGEKGAESGKSEMAVKSGFRDSYNTVKKQRYLRLIAAIVMVTLVVSTLIDFQWNTIVKVKREGDLTSFFGYFNAGLMVFAFLLSSLMTSKLFKRYGVRMCLLLYPIVLLLCFSGIGIFASLVMAVIIKGSDKSLAYTINRSARELLFIPVAPELKYKAIVFIDMFVDRFAKGIGAVLLMIILLFGIPNYVGVIRVVSLVSVVLILGWIILTLRASRAYVDSVKQKIRPPELRADQAVEKELDMDYTRLIFDTLESMDRSSDLYAMHLFELMKRGKLTPEVRQLLSARSEEPRFSSLRTFFEADPLTLMQLDGPVGTDKQLREEIQEIMSLAVYEDVIERYIENILSRRSRDTETARMEIAKGIGFLPPESPLAAKLEELLRDDSSEVRKFAIESASKLGKKEYIPALIQNLTYPSTQGDAASALAKYGASITGILADHLGDVEKKRESRKAAVSVLSRIGSQEAADLILQELEKDSRDMDRELIDALDRIRSEKPETAFSEDMVKRKVKQKIKSYYDLFLECVEAGSDRPHELTLLLVDIFKLLGLIYPHEDITKAFQNIRTGTKDSIAYAVELLDNILPKEYKEYIFPLMEEISLGDKIKRIRKMLQELERAKKP